MTAFPVYGIVDIDWSFSIEDNQVRNKYYLANYADLYGALQYLLGSPVQSANGSSIEPHQHPVFSSFICSHVNVVPVDKKTVQCSDYGSSFSTAINKTPNYKGGFYIWATYTPWANYHIVEEQWDFQGQTMSLLSNWPAGDVSKSMTWENGTICTNIRGIVKSIPKLEVYQKKILMTQVPGVGTGTNTAQQMLGAVNRSPFTFLQSDQINKTVWPEATLLCIGMPVKRCWRFDGNPCWEITFKFAANILNDKIYAGTSSNGSLYSTTGPVTWQRLYNAQDGMWEKVKFPDGSLMYPEADFSLMNSMT